MNLYRGSFPLEQNRVRERKTEIANENGAKVYILGKSNAPGCTADELGEDGVVRLKIARMGSSLDRKFKTRRPSTFHFRPNNSTIVCQAVISDQFIEFRLFSRKSFDSACYLKTSSLTAFYFLRVEYHNIIIYNILIIITFWIFQ